MISIPWRNSRSCIGKDQFNNSAGKLVATQNSLLSLGLTIQNVPYYQTPTLVKSSPAAWHCSQRSPFPRHYPKVPSIVPSPSQDSHTGPDTAVKNPPITNVDTCAIWLPLPRWPCFPNFLAFWRKDFPFFFRWNLTSSFTTAISVKYFFLWRQISHWYME